MCCVQHDERFNNIVDTESFVLLVSAIDKQTERSSAHDHKASKAMSTPLGVLILCTPKDLLCACNAEREKRSDRQVDTRPSSCPIARFLWQPVDPILCCAVVASTQPT